MDNPNAIYKASFAELREKLGRVPTSTELLPLHEEYKRAFLALPGEIAKADREYEAKVFGRAAGPQSGFSRQPAPQASAMNARATEPAAQEPLSRPNKPSEPETAVSAPEPAESQPGPAGGLIEGDRGPGGGLVGKCVKCGRLWERPARKGRPAIWCEECR